MFVSFLCCYQTFAYVECSKCSQHVLALEPVTCLHQTITLKHDDAYIMDDLIVSHIVEGKTFNNNNNRVNCYM